MNANSRFGLKLLGTAIALGVLDDFLLQAAPWGLNIAVLTIALTLAVAGSLDQSRATRCGHRLGSREKRSYRVHKEGTVAVDGKSRDYVSPVGHDPPFSLQCSWGE